MRDYRSNHLTTFNGLPTIRAMDQIDPVSAWRLLCERMATLVEDPAIGGSAEGVRHLARQLAVALEEQLEHSDARHPTFLRYEEPWRQWGAPNPDNVYVRTAVDPRATYRVWGNVGGVRDILISLVEGDMHLDEYGVFSERSLSELDVGADGDLELVVSPEPHLANWLPMDPKARMLMIRQYQCDWERDAIATFHIERADTRGTLPPNPEPEEVAAALGRAADWVEQSLRYWAAYSTPKGGTPANVLGPPRTPPGGAPHIGYGAGRWSLEPDQALLITTDVPDADYWGWAAHTDVQFDTGDFASRSTSINSTQSHLDRDGKLRIVVAATDPGVPNWIDTSGRSTGLLAYRLIGARTKPTPSAEVLSIAQLREHLPDDHPVVDADTRRDQLARRRVAALQRYV